jgi:RNA polymerase sigma-70 factor (ECF subfamily)
MRHLESVEEPAAGAATPSQVAAGHELEESIERCIASLPDKERDVIFLRRYLGLSTEEIRAELELPTEGSVRALLSRAQARLASRLGEQAP